MDIYKKCPIIESEKFTLRLTEKDDTAELLKVYSDLKAVPFFNGDNCHGDDHKEYFDYWVKKR